MNSLDKKFKEEKNAEKISTSKSLSMWVISKISEVLKETLIDSEKDIQLLEKLFYGFIEPELLTRFKENEHKENYLQYKSFFKQVENKGHHFETITLLKLCIALKGMVNESKWSIEHMYNFQVDLEESEYCDNIKNNCFYNIDSVIESYYHDIPHEVLHLLVTYRNGELG